MKSIPNKIIKYSLGIILALLITGCSAASADKAACVVFGGIPKPPPGATEITDSGFNALLRQLEDAFKTASKVTNVSSKAYYTNLDFQEVEAHYAGLLDDGWQPRPNMVSFFSGQGAEIGAWSSCTDELMVVLYYPKVNEKGSGLIVLFAKP
jgi:hypothetical protein